MSTATKRVLFVCLGNSCRSQMAEAFARTYGGDVISATSAGLTPAMGIAPDTVQAMSQKGIDLRLHFPKGIHQVGRAAFDLVVNMSGFELPVSMGAVVRNWDIPDPVFMKFEAHCDVRDEIEGMVRSLILELRREQNALAKTT